MTELKTLKDIYLGACGGNYCYVNDEAKEILKAEAVKWVKYYKGFQHKFGIGWDSNIDGVVNAFKEFFNLTEDDLKETKKDDS